MRIAATSGLRDRLVHEYEEIDDGIGLGAVGQAQSRFPRFIAEIEGFLGRTP